MGFTFFPHGGLDMERFSKAANTDAELLHISISELSGGYHTYADFATVWHRSLCLRELRSEKPQDLRNGGLEEALHICAVVRQHIEHRHVYCTYLVNLTTSSAES